MPLDKIITNITQSKTGQKFCSYIANPKNEKFINSTLPVCQVFMAEMVGLGITAFNPKIESEQKKSQLINHGLKATLNLTIVGAMSRGATSFAQKVAENLGTKGVSKNIQQGVKIGFPLLISCMLSRYLIPVILNPVSSKLRDKLNEKILNKNKNGKTINITKLNYDNMLLKNKTIQEWQNDLIKNKLDIKA